MATVKENTLDRGYAVIARAFGIRNSFAALQEARNLGIGPALAIAVLEQESSGKNVWGHDPTIFIGGFDRLHNKFWTRPSRNGYVNEAGYREYKRQRQASGNRKMQGVGPLQLTWWETQDKADRNGGAWNPRVNIRTGFQLLSSLISAHGLHDGIRRYNGSGPRAEAYARSVLERRAKWRGRLFRR